MGQQQLWGKFLCIYTLLNSILYKSNEHKQHKQSVELWFMLSLFTVSYDGAASVG